ncbi:hypothetical protein CJ179_38470 [Rhodococcus sp. ACS1]|uniref:hypothetical protein n=1 Tax=Rhodococcus sp. ACS1 TaxID=2028570 RepID=UPI000BB15615|nr:hypothetical protein [Rhodococcus sp. ACS1]PBC38486.1 hypothetical protein CJ179_38470 [Rhodococcus sp. ACS1]
MRYDEAGDLIMPDTGNWPEPQPVDIDIVELVPDEYADNLAFNMGAHGLMKTNALFVNGQRVMVPRGAAVSVDNLMPNMDGQCVAVTMTVYARTVNITKALARELV